MTKEEIEEGRRLLYRSVNPTGLAAWLLKHAEELFRLAEEARWRDAKEDIRVMKLTAKARDLLATRAELDGEI